MYVEAESVTEQKVMEDRIKNHGGVLIKEFNNMKLNGKAFVLLEIISAFRLYNSGVSIVKEQNTGRSDRQVTACRFPGFV